MARGPAISGRLLFRGRAEDVGAEVMARDAGRGFDGEDMLSRDPAITVNPRPDMALPDRLFIGGKEPGQCALASGRSYRGFER